MKGVVLTISPGAYVIDISHDVRPQRVLQAAFVTQSAWAFFPDGAVHVAVVDPGVGTDRRALALVTPRGCFAGPDNGVLSAALPDAARPGEGDVAALVSLPDGYRAFTISNPAYRREPVSATFHGRDVFAPAAAHLSIGLSPHELGEPVESMLAFPPLRARRRNDGSLDARVIHIDRFGNVVTDARAADLPDGALAVELAGESVPGLVRTYAEAAGLVALIGSSGYLEVALPAGSAAGALAVEIGDAVLVRRR
jgi:hypothetical protein